MFFRKKTSKTGKLEIDKNNLPVHIAIIMDGNGRWASKRGLSRNIGHRQGSINLKKISAFCDDLGIKYLTVFAFSTENWNRPKKEVDTLMNLMLEYMKNAEKELGGRDIRIKVIGNIKGLNDEIRQQIERVDELTKDNKGIVLNIAINYGSRDEIIRAVKKLYSDVKNGLITEDKIDEEMLSNSLFTRDIPDPDLLIRTSGEMRISNFLMWQLAYAELWFTDVLWPDFKSKHILMAIHEYQKRNRRYGGI
ncbi:MAG: isoprenyl transferase [Clostridia bacterium]|jgi:undecaprenyl diphosphate synthase